MEKVAIYARISTDNLGQDVDRQLHEVRDYCQRMGYEIAEEYVDEGFARTTRNRPSLDKLIKDARQRKFHLVISDELSRFAGTPNLLLNLLEELKLWNVHLVSVKEGISTNNAMGELVALHSGFGNNAERSGYAVSRPCGNGPCADALHAAAQCSVIKASSLQ